MGDEECDIFKFTGSSSVKKATKLLKSGSLGSTLKKSTTSVRGSLKRTNLASDSSSSTSSCSDEDDHDGGGKRRRYSRKKRWEYIDDRTSECGNEMSPVYQLLWTGFYPHTAYKRMLRCKPVHSVIQFMF